MEKNKTIKQLKSDYSWGNREKALIFYHSEAFKKKFTDIVYERFAFPVSSMGDLDSFFVDLHFSKYHVIYLDIDPIFYKLNEILTDIGESKNKRAKIYLVSSNIENFYELKKRDFPQNIFRLLDGEEIIYFPGGKKYIY